MTIERAYVHAAYSKFKGPVESNCPSDLKVTKESVIKIETDQFLDEVNKTLASEARDVVLIQDLPGAEGKNLRKYRFKDIEKVIAKFINPYIKQSMVILGVYGWIKLPFELVTFGGGSRGSGVIVDHRWRIRVHIRIFKGRPELVKGTRVYVDCKYSSYGIMILR